MPLDKILCLSANAILTIIALWCICISLFSKNATIDSIISPFQRGFCLHGPTYFQTSSYPDNIPHYGILVR